MNFGAKGGGKSYLLCVWAFLWSRTLIEILKVPRSKNPLPVGFIGRKRGVDFTKTTLETWKKIIPQEGYYIREQDKEIIIEDRVKILFGGLDDRENINKFNSAELAFFAIDQAEETERSDIGVIEASIRLIYNGIQPPYKAFFTANPAECWLKTDFVKGERPGAIFVPALPSDNEHLPDNYIERLEKSFSYDQILLQAYRDGNWEVMMSSRAVIPSKYMDELQGYTHHPEKDRFCVVCDPACFDDQTEILTSEGWKFFKNVSGEESILTLNPKTDTAEWGKITKRYCYDFKQFPNDVMNLYEGEKLNFCITSNHKLLAKKYRNAGWKLERYDKLPERFQIKRTNKWERLNRYYRERKFSHSWQDGRREYFYEFSWKDWAEFLGWFISEGCVCVQSYGKYEEYKITITQLNDKYKQEICSLLHRMGLNFYVSGKNICFINQEIGKYLLKRCGKYAHNKKIPRKLKNAPTKIIETFLLSYCKGDGTFRKGGTKTYTTTSRQLIDDLQEVLVKIGRSGKISLHNRKGDTRQAFGRTITSKYDTWRINEVKNGHNSDVIKSKVKQIKYTGNIYCVETPYHTLMVRRKGIPMWSGNTGGDECVIYVFEHYLIRDMKILHTDDTMVIVGEMMILANQYGAQVFGVDVIGIGKGVYDRLVELTKRPVRPEEREGKEEDKYPLEDEVEERQVVGIHSSRASSDPERWGNLRDEIWWSARELVIDHKVAYPKDEELRRQLCAVRYKTVSSDGKVKLEVKDETKKRLGRSPDRADDWVYGLWVIKNYVKSANKAVYRKPRQNSYNSSYDVLGYR